MANSTVNAISELSSTSSFGYFGSLNINTKRKSLNPSAPIGHVSLLFTVSSPTLGKSRSVDTFQLCR